MFKDAHQILGKAKKTKTPHKQVSKLLPILPGEKLLKTNRRLQLTKKLILLLRLDEEDFEASYGVVLNRFAEFVQGLPAIAHGKYAHIGGGLDFALERAYSAISHYVANRNKILDKTNITQEELRLWEFALFTSVLTYDIGKIACQYYVMICSDSGKAIHQWLPTAGTMLNSGTYYRFAHVAPFSEPYQRHITPIIAKTMLPDDLYYTLSAHDDIFATWLAILMNTGDVGGTGGGFQELRPLAEEQALEREEEHLARQHPEETESKEEIPTDEDTEAFLNWLKEKLKEGEITPNEKDSGVYVTAQGVLISRKLVNEFAKDSPVIKDTNSLFDQLQKSGFFLKTAQGSNIHQFTVGPLGAGDFRMALMVDSTILYNMTTIPTFSDAIKLSAPVMGTAQSTALSGKGPAQGPTQGKGPAPQTEAPKAPPPTAPAGK